MWSRALVISFVVACATHHAPPTPADTATGAVGAWQTGPALPVARANLCAAVVDNWVLAIGGNRAVAGGGFAATDEIDAAPIDANGVLGAWQVAGHTHSAVSQCNATSDGHALYVIDGLYDQMADNGRIWTAELDPAAGTLGTLVSLGALPDGDIAISTGATVHDGTLLLMYSPLGTSSTDPGDTQTLRTPLGATALDWHVDDWHLPFRAQAQYAFDDRYVLALGGYHDPAIGATTDAYSAAILTGPSIGGPSTTSPLPTPVAFGAAAIVDDWVFVVGGRAQVFGAGGTTNVYAALIAADGSLGAWQTATALAVARTNHAMVLAGDYVVVLGGAASGPGDTMVLVAQVRYPPAQPVAR